MLRSMYSGISGMKNFQTKLDVIGNNIANVNTSGFKKVRVTFQEMMSQTSSPAQGATENRGGTNASQVGLGSQIGTIDNIQTQGFRETTNNPLDLSIQGDGMFSVAAIEGAGEDGNTLPLSDTDEVYYTRAGNFYLDDNGNIVNSQGYYLMGFMGEGNVPGMINIPENASSFNIQTDGVVEYVDVNNERQVAGQVLLANFSNTAGLVKETDNLYSDSGNAGLLTDGVDNDFGLHTPEDNIGSSIVSNSLEMSNVDLSEEFTEMITAQRGFQANTRIITTSDEILQELVNLKR